MLAAVPGVTVLVHDQACAAEKRRARSRGKLAKPDFRIVINERVCEGCGDCGDKSNCLSVQPVMTEYGRKTRIHQTSCNFDMTCLEGDCPSFALVSVDADGRPAGSARPRRRRLRRRSADGLPDRLRPCRPTSSSSASPGIGGTGVVTVSQILGTAAMLGGRTVRGLDQTGLSQKAGPVVSDLRISANGTPMSNRANSAGVDCFLAFDLLVGASDTHRTGARAGRTDRHRLGGADADGGDGHQSDDAVPGARRAHRPPRRGVAAATPTATRTPRRSPAGCSATRRPPTSSSSASPCRPGRSPSTPR